MEGHKLLDSANLVLVHGAGEPDKREEHEVWSDAFKRNEWFMRDQTLEGLGWASEIGFPCDKRAVGS